jgi:aminopeptidase N
MENMGLITIDSLALQIDEHADDKDKRYAALLITHEIAHHV